MTTRKLDLLQHKSRQFQTRTNKNIYTDTVILEQRLKLNWFSRTGGYYTTASLQKGRRAAFRGHAGWLLPCRCSSSSSARSVEAAGGCAVRQPPVRGLSVHHSRRPWASSTGEAAVTTTIFLLAAHIRYLMSMWSSYLSYGILLESYQNTVLTNKTYLPISKG